MRPSYNCKRPKYKKYDNIRFYKWNKRYYFLWLRRWQRSMTDSCSYSSTRLLGTLFPFVLFLDIFLIFLPNNQEGDFQKSHAITMEKNYKNKAKNRKTTIKIPSKNTKLLFIKFKFNYTEYTAKTFLNSNKLHQKFDWSSRSVTCSYCWFSPSPTRISIIRMMHVIASESTILQLSEEVWRIKIAQRSYRNLNYI